MAFKAIELEPKVGAMLPCNVILRQDGESIEISAVDPQASMAEIQNPRLAEVAGEVRNLLELAVRSA